MNTESNTTTRIKLNRLGSEMVNEAHKGSIEMALGGGAEALGCGLMIDLILELEKIAKDRPLTSNDLRTLANSLYTSRAQI